MFKIKKKKVWTTNIFKPWLCADGRVLSLHLFLIIIFLYIYIFSPDGDVNVFSWNSSVVFSSYLFESIIFVGHCQRLTDWAWRIKTSLRQSSTPPPPSCCLKKGTMFPNQTGKSWNFSIKLPMWGWLWDGWVNLYWKQNRPLPPPPVLEDDRWRIVFIPFRVEMDFSPSPSPHPPTTFPCWVRRKKNAFLVFGSPCFGLCVPALALMSRHLFFSTPFWGTQSWSRGFCQVHGICFFYLLYEKCTAFCLFVLRIKLRQKKAKQTCLWVIWILYVCK